MERSVQIGGIIFDPNHTYVERGVDFQVGPFKKVFYQEVPLEMKQESVSNLRARAKKDGFKLLIATSKKV